jgi:hypothetical protein
MPDIDLNQLRQTVLAQQTRGPSQPPSDDEAVFITPDGEVQVGRQPTDGSTPNRGNRTATKLPPTIFAIDR